MEHTPTYGGTPTARRRRWPKVALIIGLAFATLVGVGFASGLITVYGTTGNAGIVIGWECHNLGFEWRGNPGFFTDSCS